MQKHRISTNLGIDQKITVELKQDFDVLEILSLKFSQQEIYTSICSDYGVVCGRVTANNGFGLGNARVSIFIPLSTEDENDPVISSLYPYKQVTDKDDNNYRYNLLPSRQQHGGHAATGTFPDQSDILTREEVLEVYEKYYKFTVKTNPAGDFMIWGVPVGNQTIHVDVDLSDIGCFSLRPYDLQRLGIGVDGFKNKYTFKSSDDLDSLPQIVSFDKLIEVYPFWGNESLCEIGITRTDFDLSERGVNIKPTAYLIGGVFSDSAKNSVNKNCTPRRKMGRKCDLVTKSANIEALRFKPIKDDLGRPFLEYLSIDEDIPDDGGFVLPLEMNMDYIITNEFGENEYTNDFNKGIATSACYRFRFNLNDNGLDRARANADFLVPNIREFQKITQTGATPSQTGYTVDDKSYYFGLDYSGYPTDAQSLILNNENGQFKPKDYFYRFNYNKVYTVSSFHSHFIDIDVLSSSTLTLNLNRKYNFANINEILPSEEEDCSDKVTPPANFGVRNYTFTLLIADFLLLLDYVIKFLTLQFLNFTTFLFSWIAETIISIDNDYRFLRENVTEFQINNQTALSLINYPECVECADENVAAVGGGQSGFTIDYINGGCSMYDTLYDESLATGYFIQDLTNTNEFIGCPTPASYLPHNKGRRYVTTLSGLTNYTLLSTAIYGDHRQGVPLTDYKNSYNNGDYPTDIRNFSCQQWSFNGGFKTQSARSEFYNGVFYIVPGTQTARRLTKILDEYYRRKRVGKMFCGGIVNYGFIDNWLSGSLYFTQFKVKKLRRLATATSEGVLKYCRSLVRFVFDQKRFYYRSASFTTATGFDKDNLNRPTTIVDLGPRDEFIKEICIDKSLDPNCSVARSIGATSQQFSGDLLGLAINYRMDTANANGKLDIFFNNQSFLNAGIPKALDGDILQLVSINNEAGIDQFDLENPKYLGYRFDFLDPEDNPSFFKIGNDWGPLPVTLELDEDGQRIRSCLNDRLNDSSQEVPFYLWDKGSTGFGPGGVNRSNQGWDYTTPISVANGNLQTLQGMTFGYTLTGGTNDPSDKFLLLPITNTNSGVTGNTSVNITDVVEYDIIYSGSTTGDTGYTQYNMEYPGFSVLSVTGGTIENPTAGTLYIRYGNAGTNGIVGWQKIPWSSTTDLIIPRREDYYSTRKQILSTPFHFYFGLSVGKTGLDKFIDLFGPNGAFNLLECETTSIFAPISTPTPSPTPTSTPTPSPTPSPSPTPTITSTISTLTPTPTSTPYRIVANDLWIGDSGDVEFGDDTSCAHTSPVNTVYGGVDAWLYSATNICDATSIEADNSLGFNWVLEDMSENEYIWISQTGITYNSTLGSYVRLYKRSGTTNTLLPSGTCINCLTINDPTPTPTPIPLINVNIYGQLRGIPYSATTNNVQLIYQTYYAPTLGSIGYTTTGIQKDTTENGTFLTSISVNQGGVLNLGIFRRVQDGECAYREINANVFAGSEEFSSLRFTNSTGAILSDTGIGLQGNIYGVSIPISSQSVDIYVSYVGDNIQITNTPPLPCLTAGGPEEPQ